MLDSVYGQNPLPAKHVFVDGGSTDGTLDAVRDMKRKFGDIGVDTVFEVLGQEKKDGIFGAWNQALERMDTELVFILNADDWYEPGASRTVLKHFTENADSDIFCASAWFHDPETGEKYLRRCRSTVMFPVLMPIVHPACFVRKKVYDSIGFFNPEYPVSADYDFVYRAYKAGMKFEMDSAPLVNMQLGGNANSRRDEARKETRDIALRHCRIKPAPWIAYAVRALTAR